jgi:hypothetical protein
MDGPPGHAFTITPAAPLFVGCADAAAVDTALDTLTGCGAVLVAPGSDGVRTNLGE